MKLKYILLTIIFTFSLPCISQNSNDFGDWSQEIRRDDFGDFRSYQYEYLGYDKFNSNYIFIRLEKNRLRIYRAINVPEFIKYSKNIGAYTVKVKNEYGIINNDRITQISGKGGLHFDSYSNLFQQIISGKGKTLSVVIYNSDGERINSFDVSSFIPIFR